MAELVDALVSEASEVIHGGSNPLSHTKKVMNFIINKTSLTKYEGRDKIVTIPFGVEEIEDEVFYNNQHVEVINLPSSVKRIGRKAFSCLGESFKYIVLPRSINYIDNRAFDCSKIEKIYILNSDVLIDVEAFDHCYELSDIYFVGSEKQWDEAILKDEDESLITSSDIKIYFDYKLSYEELVNGINNDLISSVEFFVKDYSHYSNCVISKNKNVIELKLTSDDSESLISYDKFIDNIKIFVIKGQDKFTLKDIYKSVVIKNIVFTK